MAPLATVGTSHCYKLSVAAGTMTHEPEFNFRIRQINIIPGIIKNIINGCLEFIGNTFKRIVFLPLIINAIRRWDLQDLSGLETVGVVLQNIIVCPQNGFWFELKRLLRWQRSKSPRATR